MNKFLARTTLTRFYYSSQGQTPLHTRTGMYKQYGNNPSTAQSVGFSYNETSMMTLETTSPNSSAATPLVHREHKYDAMGNRTEFYDYYGQGRYTFEHNNLNQVGATHLTISSGDNLSYTHGYDADGNMLSQLLSYDRTSASTFGTLYTWDQENRLTSISDVTNNGTQVNSKYEFVYDGLSRLRISRYYVRQSNGALLKQSEKRRVYDGMEIVQERDANNSVTASLTRTGNIGGILARTTQAGSVFYGYDGSGNVVTLTNSAGAEVGSYNYDAWGNSLSQSGVAASENPYRYSTKESIAGMYSYGFRFYSPGFGRFINRDPIGEAGGTNLYGFVGNNPVNMIDAYGRNMMGLSMWNPMHKTGITESDSPIRMPGGASRDPVIYYGRDCQGRAITTNGNGDFYYKDALIKKYGTLNLRSRFTWSGVKWFAAAPIGGFPAGTVFRSGKGNPGNFRTRIGEEGLSVRNSLSEPYPMGPHGPVFRDKFTAINPAEYGGLKVDNKPPGHATLPGLGAGATEVPGKIGTYDFE